MALNLNADVQNLPGVKDREMDKLIGLRAALAVLGSLQDKREVEFLMHQFVPWLENSHGASDKLVRRYVLLTVAEGHAAGAETDPVKLRKLVESVYSMT